MTGVGLSILAVAILASAPASGQSAGRVFSDVCIERGSDDARGHEVIVQSLGRHPRIWLSWSEGGLAAPVLASAVRFEPHSRTLTFEASTSGGVAHFDGHLGPTALTGRLQDYWRKTASKVRLTLTTSKTRPLCGRP